MKLDNRLLGLADTQMMKAKHPSPTPVQETYYVYDNYSHLKNMLSTLEYSGGVLVSQTDHIYGNGLVASRDSSGEDLYYHYNLQGSVTAITDSTGAVVDRFEYSPYGKSWHIGPRFLLTIS